MSFFDYSTGRRRSSSYYSTTRCGRCCHCCGRCCYWCCGGCCMVLIASSYAHDWCFQNPVSSRICAVYFDHPFDDEQRTLKCKVALWVTRTILNFLGSLLSVYLLWLLFFRPYKVRPYVDAAVLTAFDFTSDDTAGHYSRALQYDLTLNVTFFNDHRIYGVRFDHLTARLYYNGTELGPADDSLPPSFNLGTRRHRTVYPTLRGRARAGDVGAAVVEELSRQQAEGRLSLDVRVKTTLTYMFWPTRATYYYEYDCWLQFPAPVNSSEPEVTSGVRCRIAK